MTSNAFQASGTRDGDGSIAAYEELRGRVLTGSTSDGHGGVLLLIREGIAGWITRGSSRAASYEPPVGPPPRAASTPPGFDDLRAGIVRGLASMVLASRGQGEVRP